MARTKSYNVQINIFILTGWKTELENPARIYSVEEGESIIFLDLLRRGIQEKINQVNKPVRNNIKVLRIINI